MKLPGEMNRPKVLIGLGFFMVWQVILGGFTVIGFKHIDELRKDDCSDAMHVRQESLENDLRIFTELGRATNASPDLLEPFLNTIREGYDQLPPPVDCT